MRGLRYSSNMKEWGKRIIVILLIIGGLVAFNIPNLFREFIYPKEGEIANRTIIAPYDFYYEDKEATKIKFKSIHSTVEPVYKLNLMVIPKIEENIEELFNRTRDLKENESLSERSKIIKLRSEFLDKIPTNYLSKLLACKRLYSLEQDVKKIVNFWQTCGVSSCSEIKLKKDAERGKGIRLKILSDTGVTEKYIKDEKDLDKIFILGSNKPVIIPEGLISPDKELAVALARLFIQPNLEYSEKDTQKELVKVKKNILPVLKEVKKGELLVRKNQIIDNLTYLKLQALSKEITSKGRIKFLGYLSLILVIVMIIIIWGIKLYKNLLLPKNLILIGCLIIGILNIAKIMQICNFSLLGLPVATFGIIVAILMKESVSIFLSIILCLLLDLLMGIPREVSLILLLGTLMSIYTISYVRVKTDLIKPAIVTSLVNGITIVGFNLIGYQRLGDLGLSLFWGVGVNGFFCMVFSWLILHALERLAKITTNFRLFELSDLNLPILKKLLIHAPGTYHHSLLVGTLAEAAARVCQANPILTRVGAYYHDIGKMNRPYYFPENQIGSEVKAKFFQVKTDLLASIYKSHIKDGIVLAKENKLPQEIIDIINQHHGTSEVFPVYRYKSSVKVSDNNNWDSSEVKEKFDHQVIRYDGPKPKIKEAALIMLADAVETASRNLEHPTTYRIENLVKKIIHDKFEERELDECDLTLKDLDNISFVFIKTLTTLFYSRVEPELVEGENLSLLSQRAQESV